MKIFQSILFFCFFTILISCKKTTDKNAEINTIELISVKNTQFYKGQKPYYFVGTNYWYGPLIAAKNIGDRERLLKELDLMKEVGIDNLRILVGAEGDGGDSL